MDQSMNNSNVNVMFERATREKLRFSTTNGVITVEDLWDLPLTSTRRANLDDIAKSMRRKLVEVQEESFVTPKGESDAVLALELAFDIVKYVISVKLRENEEARVLADRRRQRDRIMEIMAQKQDRELEAKSLEELQGLLAAL